MSQPARPTCSPQRLLCQEHGVSTIVVRQAIFALRTEGLVEGVKGVGVFVAERLPGASDKPDR
ncbi:GntR family transcriptional regulator [Micromonospora eburnea]|uniref:GntR family transcriptional regulator n=1 Tax=Micromonospora eburnea TaxID=227316 RepID=UPI0036279D2F